MNLKILQITSVFKMSLILLSISCIKGDHVSSQQEQLINFGKGTLSLAAATLFGSINLYTAYRLNLNLDKIILKKDPIFPRDLSNQELQIYRKRLIPDILSNISLGFVTYKFLKKAYSSFCALEE